MSERDRSYSRDRNRDARDYRETRVPSSRPHYGEKFPVEPESPSYTERYTPEPEPRQRLYNLKYFCTGRALCQALNVMLNLLIVVCAAVPYNNSTVYRDLASLGGLYAYYYGGASAFTGAQAQQVQQLDAQFYQLKLPVYVCAMALGGAVLAYACATLLLGVLLVPVRWPPVLLLEAVLDVPIALGYLPAVAFFFIKLREAYGSDACAQREQLYASKGLQGYDCKLNGGDVCAGLLGVLAVVSFLFGAALAVRAFREVRERKRRPQVEFTL